MKHGIDRAALSLQKIEQRFGGQDSHEVALGNVSPLVALTQAVANNDLGFAASLQGSHNVGTDESSAAGNDDHALPPRRRLARSIVSLVL